jgi:hypothetical protein
MYIVVFHLLANLPLDVHPLFVSVQKRFWLQADVLAYILAGTSAGTVLRAIQLELRAGSLPSPFGGLLSATPLCAHLPIPAPCFAGRSWQLPLVVAAVAVLAVRVAHQLPSMQQSDNWCGFSLKCCGCPPRRCLHFLVLDAGG